MLICCQSVNGIAYLCEIGYKTTKETYSCSKWHYTARYFADQQHLSGSSVLKVVRNRGKITFFSAALPRRWWKNWFIQSLGALNRRLILREMAKDLGISVGSRFIVLTENLGIRCVSLKFIAGLPRLNKKRTDWTSAQNFCNMLKRMRTSCK